MEATTFKRSKLTSTGMALTLLAFFALIGRSVVFRPDVGGSLLILAAFLDLLSMILLPVGVSCWIIGALRDRRARKGARGPEAH